MVGWLIGRSLVLEEEIHNGYFNTRDGHQHEIDPRFWHSRFLSGSVHTQLCCLTASNHSFFLHLSQFLKLISSFNACRIFPSMLKPVDPHKSLYSFTHCSIFINLELHVVNTSIMFLKFHKQLLLIPCCNTFIT
jgi:hypothetical protein